MNTVTGATGLLGSHLVVHLLQSGAPVRVIHRKQSRKEHLLEVLRYYAPNAEELYAKIDFIEANLLDVNELYRALKGTEYLYHCAAMVSFNPGDSAKLLEVNPETTANVVNCALDLPIKKMVYVSSVAALGRKKGQRHFDEKSEWVESKRNSAYAKSKYLAELEVWRGIEEGLTAAIINPTIILGAGNWQQGSAAIIDTIARGFKFYSTGKNGFVDARDLAEIMQRLMHSSISGERFVTVGENWYYKDVFFAIADALQIKRPPWEAKPWMTELVWRLEKLKLLWGGTPAVTRETAYSARQVYEYHADKVKETLNFEFRPLEESIKDFCALYKGVGGTSEKMRRIDFRKKQVY